MYGLLCYCTRINLCKEAGRLWPNRKGRQRNLFCLILMKRRMTCCWSKPSDCSSFTPYDGAPALSLPQLQVWALPPPALVSEDGETGIVSLSCLVRVLNLAGNYPNSSGAISITASPHWRYKCWDWAADGIDLDPYDLMWPCRSPYNTPILPVQKPGRNEYQFVHDLRAINQIVEDIHPVVPNPCTLFTTLSGDFCWFIVLELKNAFSCIPLNFKYQE